MITISTLSALKSSIIRYLNIFLSDQKIILIEDLCETFLDLYAMIKTEMIAGEIMDVERRYLV